MARAFLLETAEAAAEAARLRRLALGLEPAQPGLELVQVGAAPTVLPLVELSLPLGEELLSRGDRVGVLGELAAGAEEGPSECRRALAIDMASTMYVIVT